MKTYLSIIVQIVFLLLLSHLSFSQEVELKLAGNDTSDAFVVKDSSGNVLLKMDGDKNFGINSEQPDGIEIRGRDESQGPYNPSGSVSIIGGYAENEVGGSINIASGYGGDNGNSGDVNITTGGGAYEIGDINISAISWGNSYGGDINLSTGGLNGLGNGGNITLTTEVDEARGPSYIKLLASGKIELKTQGSEYSNGIRIETGYNVQGANNIELTVGNGDEEEGGIPRGIILNPSVGLVEIIGSGTYTGTWTQASDERYKSKIKPLPGILSKVNLLQPVEYEWNKEEYPENNFPDGNQIGLIAQEVEKLFPEIVATNQDGYKSIDYSKISVLLLQAMKEQQNETDKMKSELEELKSMIMQESNKFSSNDNQQEVK